MDVGSIFYIDGEPYIVTAIKNGNIHRTEPLKSFIARTRVIMYEGQQLSVQEAIQTMCDDYIRRYNLRNL